MNQLCSTPEMQSLGYRQKRPDLAKLHLDTLFAHLITNDKSNNNSNETRRYLTGCGESEFDATERKEKRTWNSISYRSKPHAARYCEVQSRWPVAPFWRTSFPRRCSAPQHATRSKRRRRPTCLRACAPNSTPFPWKRKSLLTMSLCSTVPAEP